MLKSKMNLKKILVTTSVVALAIGVGTFLGIFLGGIFNTPHAEQDEFIVPVMDDINKTYETLNNVLDGQNISNVDLSQTKLTASDLANLAIDISLKNDKILMVQVGDSFADNSVIKVQQFVSAAYVKDGDSYCSESSASSSFVKSSKRFYLKSKSNDISNVYEAKQETIKELRDDSNSLYGIIGSFDETSIKTKSYFNEKLENGTSTDFNTKDIISTFGKPIYTPIVYDISNDSVIFNAPTKVIDPHRGDETATTGIFKLESGNYKISLILNPLKAIINYAVQMGSENKMIYDPVFNQCLLEFIVTPELKILTKRTHEFYDVFPAQTNGGDTPTYGQLIDKYFYNDEIAYRNEENSVESLIPKINESFHYDYFLKERL